MDRSVNSKRVLINQIAHGIISPEREGIKLHKVHEVLLTESLDIFLYPLQLLEPLDQIQHD